MSKKLRKKLNCREPETCAESEHQHPQELQDSTQESESAAMSKNLSTQSQTPKPKKPRAPRKTATKKSAEKSAT